MASDYFLSAPTQAALFAGLLTTFTTGFTTTGSTPDGGSWRLQVLGLLNSPAPQVTLQPVEPGNFTNRVGLPEQPALVTGLNQNVGIESIPDTVSAFWVKLSWNSGSPLPNFGAQGITLSTTSPYAVHY